MFHFTISEMTFLEESLLKQAQDENQKREKEAEEETEIERIAELRRKGRGKGNVLYFNIMLIESHEIIEGPVF